MQEGRLRRGGDKADKCEDDKDETKSGSDDAAASTSSGGGKKKRGGGVLKSAAKSAAHKLSPKATRKKPRATVALMKVYPNELEAQEEFSGFTEWLQTFELYRGKKGAEEFEDDGRIVGKFKVRLMRLLSVHCLIMMF